MAFVKVYEADTIVAIATPIGQGGIGVVRLSGQDLLSFVERLCGARPSARHATLTDFIDADGTAIDTGILLYFPAPHSFTGEDVVELQGHGGILLMQLLLRRCCELGARLAEPGEFSKRSYLNGKMDLAQAEAVADLIESSSVVAAKSALRSLSGGFSIEVNAFVRELISIRMLVEASFDFPEEELDLAGANLVQARLSEVIRQLGDLLLRSRAGSALRSGLRVVLAGLPNVGKSSLLNSLAGEEKAIVTDVAGTTRDVIRETIFISGVPLHIIDTAGLRQTDDVVERIGVERAWSEIGNSDIIVQMVDARCVDTEADRHVTHLLPSDVRRIVVENKSDLARVNVSRYELGGVVHIRLCAKSGLGVDILRKELLEAAGWVGNVENVVFARTRHIGELMKASEHINAAALIVGRLELCAEELMLAQNCLSRITGEFSSDDLLGEIFSSFCIGK